MQREVWVFFFTCIFVSSAFSQEKSIFSQAYLDPFIMNPACAGYEFLPVARLAVEKRWTGFKDSPSTVLITGNTRIGNYNFYTPKGLVNKSPFRIGDNAAIGGALYYDSNGPLNTTGGLLSYAYHVPLNKQSRLSMGLSANMQNLSLNTSVLQPEQPGDNYLLNKQNDMFSINFGIGLYYYMMQFFTGISLTGLFPLYTAGTMNSTGAPGLYILSGYRFEKIARSIELEPSVIVRKPAGDENVYFDFFSRMYFLKYHWAAISYSTSGLAEIMLVLRLYNSLYVGYNYMYSLGRIASYNYGSHRISVGINMGRGMDKWNYYN